MSISDTRVGDHPAPMGESCDEGAAPLGRHLLADFFGVEPRLLTDETALMALLGAALQRAGFHQLARHSHKFPGPGGVTGLVLLSESHAAFHTYPEHQYIAIDVFSCGMADPTPVVDALAEALAPQRQRRQLRSRGASPPSP